MNRQIIPALALISMGAYILIGSIWTTDHITHYNCDTDIPKEGTIKNPTSEDIIRCKQVMSEVKNSALVNALPFAGIALIILGFYFGWSWNYKSVKEAKA